MKNNKLLVGGILLALAATSARGAETASHDPGLQDDIGNYYRPNELSFDGFGSGSLDTFTGDQAASSRQNIRIGAGAGINYFITRNFGLGADAYSEDTSGAFVDSASISLILRQPLGQSRFAPYVFGGGGRHLDTVKMWFGQAGTGLEYRLARHVGIFLDVRAVWPSETKFYGVARLGMRFAF